jgi:hypothetical protein
MADTSQGPGWWQASDGKWYPPQPPPPQYPPHAQQYPPPGYVPGGPGPGWIAPAATSGLAIASLVLSILWIGGLGSILAVVFGVVALSQIRNSQGRKQGSGLAIAGLIIGGIGILGSGAFYAAVVAIGKTFSTTTLQLGQAGHYSASDNDGIVSITVSDVTFPWPAGAPTGFVGTGGAELAVATVTQCAGPDGAPNGASAIGWELHFPGGTIVTPTDDAKTPGLDSINSVGANKCVTGYLTFAIAIGSHPAYIHYSGAIVHPYQWALP